MLCLCCCYGGKVEGTFCVRECRPSFMRRCRRCTIWGPRLQTTGAHHSGTRISTFENHRTSFIWLGTLLKSSYGIAEVPRRPSPRPMLLQGLSYQSASRIEIEQQCTAGRITRVAVFSWSTSQGRPCVHLLLSFLPTEHSALSGCASRKMPISIAPQGYSSSIHPGTSARIPFICHQRAAFRYRSASVPGGSCRPGSSLAR